MKKPNWEILKPSEYSSFEWFTTNLQNHFNGEYYFRQGEIGRLLKKSENIRLDSNAPVDIGFGSSRRLRNYFVYDTPKTFKDNLIILPNGYSGEAINSSWFNQDFKISFSDVNLLTTAGAIKRVEYNNDTYQILPDSEKKFISYDDFNDGGVLEMFEDISRLLSLNFFKID
jgi:hypothetical protein